MAPASITLDFPPSRMRQGLKSRIECQKRSGRSMNVGMCAYVEFMRTKILAETNATTDQDMEEISMEADGEVKVLSDA